LKESYLTIITLFISNGYAYSWSEAIAMAADDALIQAMRESCCGRLCSNKPFI